MQAKQLHEVLARVVAWHNRHPLALRISPQQVHSIGGVALPFASAQRPPDPPPSFDELLNPPPADPLAPWAGPAHATIDTAGHEPSPTTPLPALPDVPPVEAATEAPADAPPDAAVDEPVDAPPHDAAVTDASAAPPADAGTPAGPASDEAPIELAMALDEVAAQADAEAAAARAAADNPPPEPPSDSPPPDSPAADADASTEVLSAPDADTAADATLAIPATEAATAAQPDPARHPDNPADAAAGDAPLADRLRAARERAMASGGSPLLDLDIGHNGPAGPAGHADPVTSAVPHSTDALAAPQGWRARLAALRQRLAPRLPRGMATRPGRTTLSALFSQDFMWPRTPGQVARWVQQHGSEQPLAPPDWPQRHIETDAALLQAARRQGRPHAVTRHVLTAAIGVGDRRIRVLIDAEGHVLGPRAFDRRRIARLGSAGTVLGAVLLTAVLGPWRHAAPAGDGHAAEQAAAAASQAEAASAALAAASAASAAHAAASDAADEHDAHAGHGAPAHAAETHETETRAADAHGAPHAASAPTDAHGLPAADTAHAVATPAAPVAASAPASVVTVTQVPPPPYPVTRASGPIVAIRFRLSDEAKQAARDEVLAARAAARGEAPPPSPAKPMRLAPTAPLETPLRVAQQPGTVFAVVTPLMPQRESAEAILAQMMSVRARLPAPAPGQGEVLQHQGRWRATWYPFASMAEAERARAMLVSRGMRAEIVEF